jgi:excisionase family DNA binding protein
MAEPSPSPFDLLVAQIRTVVREEIKAALNGNGSLEPLLGAEEVAKILGVDLRDVYRQARTKKIPSIKVGKYWKFSPAELQKWLERKNTP